MSRIKSKPTQYTMKHKTTNSHRRRQSTDANNEMTQMMKLSNKYLKVAIIKMLKRVITNTSGQDGGVSRYTLPPCTTKRRTTTNLKTKNNQDC